MGGEKVLLAEQETEWVVLASCLLKLSSAKGRPFPEGKPMSPRNHQFRDDRFVFPTARATPAA